MEPRDLIQSGNYRGLTCLLEGDLDPNTTLPEVDNRSLLMEAVRCNQEECCDVLLNHQADVCVTDTTGATVLHYCTQHSSPSILNKILKDSDCSDIINKQDNDGATALHYAMSRDDYPDIGSLLTISGEVDVNLADNEGYTALHVAAELDNVTMINNLLKMKNCDVNLVSCRKTTALHQAVMFASSEAVFSIISGSTPDVNMKDCNQQTALHMACHYSTPEVVEILLSRGVHVNDVDCKGLTPLLYALKNKPSIVSTLLTIPDLEVSQQHTGLKWTPLQVACRYDRPSEAKMLLDTGKVNIASKDVENMNALHLAAKCGGTGCLSVLLGYGVNDLVNCQDIEGYTALHHAAEYKNKEKVELILRHCNNSDLNIQDYKGYTILHKAISCENKPIDTINLILNLKPDISKVLNTGDTLLHFAVKGCDVDIVQKMILSGGCRLLNSVNSRGLTPLHLAVRYRSSVVKLLLQYEEVDVNAEERIINWTPLKHAVRYGSLDTVKLLLSHKDIKMNHIDKDWENELIIASASGSPELIQLLLHYGADTRTISKFGDTALSMALGNTTEVFKLLLDAGSDINIKLPHGPSLLHEAISLGDLEKCKLLINKGINTDLAWEDLSPLQFSIIIRSDPEIISLLAMKHISSVPSFHWVSSICKLFEKCHFIEPLNTGHANNNGINRQDANGQTLLHHAVSQGIEKHVQILLSEGSDVHAKDKNSISPLHLCTQHLCTFNLLYKYMRPEQINDVLFNEIVEFAKWYGNEEVLHQLKDATRISSDVITQPTVVALGDVYSWHVPASNSLDMFNKTTYELMTPNIGSTLNNNRSQAVKTAIMQFMKSLSAHMKSLDPLLYFKPVLYGSTREGTKCGNPDEFDFLCSLTNLESNIDLQKIQDSSNIKYFETFVRVKVKSQILHNMAIMLQLADEVKKYGKNIAYFKCFKKPSSRRNLMLKSAKNKTRNRKKVVSSKVTRKYPRGKHATSLTKYKHEAKSDVYMSFTRFVNETGDFQTIKFLNWFNQMLSIALCKQSPVWRDCSPHLYISNSAYLKYKSGLANIQLIWRCKEYKDMTISIDMIPALPLQPTENNASLPNPEVNNAQLFAIPKLSGYKGMSDEMRVSYSDAETMLLINCPSSAKRGYILAKTLRHRFICPKIISPVSSELKSAEKIVNTYLLKTCFFHSLKEVEDILSMEDEEEADEIKINEYKENKDNSLWWAERIFSTLEQYARNGRVPSYFVNGYDIFCNIETDDADDLIYRFKHNDLLQEKRNLVLAFCHIMREIISYLKKRDAESDMEVT